MKLLLLASFLVAMSAQANQEIVRCTYVRSPVIGAEHTYEGHVFRNDDGSYSALVQVDGATLCEDANVRPVPQKIMGKGGWMAITTYVGLDRCGVSVQNYAATQQDFNLWGSMQYYSRKFGRVDSIMPADCGVAP